MVLPTRPPERRRLVFLPRPLWKIVMVMCAVQCCFILVNNNFFGQTEGTSKNPRTSSDHPIGRNEKVSMEALASATDTMTPGDALKFKVAYGIKTYFRALINTTSPLFWEDLVPHVIHVEVGAFCLPWDSGQRQADDWWTHHPEWEVFNETQTGYCFRPAVNPTKREFLTQVYQKQFHHPQGCENLFVARMWSSGWSADILNLVHTLQYAHKRNQVMQITSIPWHYSAPDQAGRPNKVPSQPACPLLNMYCYFLNLTECPVQDPDAYNREYNYLDRQVASVRSDQWLPDYIVRPQTWFRRKIFDFIQKQHQSAIPASATPCTVMHVRRGDVLHHGNQSRRYHAISEYLEVPMKNTSIASPSFQIHPHILLLTDDANAIVEAQQYTQYHWMFIDRPRFRADEGGWEHQVPSNNPIFEMTVLLGTFALVRQCQSIVYSTSGFSTWLLHEMKKTGQDIGSYNLDDAVEYQRGVHNRASKNISTAFEALKERESKHI